MNAHISSSARPRLASLAFSVLTLIGCSGVNDIVGAGGTSTVRFVNATNSAISVNANGMRTDDNSNLGFGQHSSCITVSAYFPSLIFLDSNGVPVTTFIPNLAAFGKYTIVAYTAANGSTLLATLSDNFHPTADSTGVAVFNAAPGSGSVVLNADGRMLNAGASTPFGNASTRFNAPAGTLTYSFDTGPATRMIAETGTVAVQAGDVATVILAPPARDSTAMRAFVTTGCQ